MTFEFHIRNQVSWLPKCIVGNKNGPFKNMALLKRSYFIEDGGQDERKSIAYSTRMKGGAAAALSAF